MVSSYTWSALPRWQRVELLQALLARDNNRCVICGSPDNKTVDHILPISKGGPVMDLRNMQILCRKCHEAKTWHEQH